ncbi:ABC transporter ATP-binding protein [Patescibacteria group bacterium]|nr:MAG: ABC transporter ATP-binding protein [Patescibacteria group bacterium]
MLSQKSALIQVQNLCKTYGMDGTETQAVCGASFDIERGEFVSIMGPSGSGKSTLMQMLGMLDRPTEGRYFFEGLDTAKFTDDELAKIRNQKIGFVFQAFNLLPRTTVFENVELPLLYDEKKYANNEERVMKALRAVGMEHRKDYFSNQLSGGEKQRVAIARALINEPGVIFADEPTGNLDSKSGLQVMKLLDQLNDEGHTIILVTHETTTAEFAKRIIRMMDGKIVADEKVKNRVRDIDGDKLK